MVGEGVALSGAPCSPLKITLIGGWAFATKSLKLMA